MRPWSPRILLREKLVSIPNPSRGRHQDTFRILFPQYTWLIFDIFGGPAPYEPPKGVR